MFRKGDEPVHGYRLQEFLGRGAFGEVWKSSAPGGTRVALKLINLSGKQGLKEYKAVQRVKEIRHAHLLPIHAFWMLDQNGDAIEDPESVQLDLAAGGVPAAAQGTMYVDRQRPTTLVVAMMLGDKSLHDRLLECQRLFGEDSGIPVDELLEHMEDAAKGIDFLNSSRHDLGEGPVSLQHCDIKPQNILLVGNSALICDFGLARVLGDTHRTTTGMAGSPAYMAPECIRNRKPSRTTDQYSLAITYYELRTGALPFTDDSYGAVLEAHLSGSLNLSRLADAERQVIERATEVDAEKRYGSSRELVRALRRVVERPISGDDSRRLRSLKGDAKLSPPPPRPAPPPAPADVPAAARPTPAPVPTADAPPAKLAAVEVAPTPPPVKTPVTPPPPTKAPVAAAAPVPPPVMKEAPPRPAPLPKNDRKESLANAPTELVDDPTAVAVETPEARTPDVRRTEIEADVISDTNEDVLAKAGGKTVLLPPRSRETPTAPRTADGTAAPAAPAPPAIPGGRSTVKARSTAASSRRSSARSSVRSSPRAPAAGSATSPSMLRRLAQTVALIAAVALIVAGIWYWTVDRSDSRKSTLKGKETVAAATDRTKPREEKDGQRTAGTGGNGASGEKSSTDDSSRGQGGEKTKGGSRTRSDKALKSLTLRFDPADCEASVDGRSQRLDAAGQVPIEVHPTATVRIEARKTDYDDFRQTLTVDQIEARQGLIKLERTAEYHLRQGLEKLQQGRLDEAIEDLNKAIQRGAATPLAHNGRGEAYLKKNDLDRALADLEQAIALDPTFAPAYENRGHVHRAKGDLDRAIADYEQSRRLWGAMRPVSDRPLVETLVARGRRRAQAGQPADAQADFTTAIALDASYAEAFVARGGLFTQQQDFDRAIDDYRTAMRLAGVTEEIRTGLCGAYTQRAMVHNRQKRHDQAIADATEALALKEDADALGARAYAYNEKQEYDKAIADLDAVIRINPRDAVAYNNRGFSYSGKRMFDRAVADLTTAITLRPINPIAYANRGYAHRQLANWDLAIGDFETALAQKPESPEAVQQGLAASYAGRAEAKSSRGHTDGALEDYEKAVRAWSGARELYRTKIAPLYLSRAKANGREKRYEASIADATSALNYDVNLTDAYVVRGVSHVHVSKFDAAVADFTQVVRREPKSARGYKFRGYAYLVKGDANLAIFDLNTAIGLDGSDPESYELRSEAYKTRRQEGDRQRSEADMAKARELRGK